MKKILYVIAALLLMCESCNEVNEEERYTKIDNSTYIDLQTGDTILIEYVDLVDTCNDSI